MPASRLDDMTAPLAAHQLLAAHSRKKSAITCLGWSSEGRHLVTGNKDGDFTLWSGVDFRWIMALNAHQEHQCNALAWAHNGKMMISGDSSGNIMYFDKSMTLMHTINRAHEGAAGVNSLDFAPTDEKMASASDDGSVSVWDVRLACEDRKLEGHGWKVLTVAWHPAFRMIASGSARDMSVRLWDPRTSENDGCLAVMRGHKNDVTQVAWNPVNGNWLLSASKDNTVRVHDVRSMKEPVTLLGHNNKVMSVAWHPTHERLFASGGFDGTLCYWLAGLTEPQAVVRHAHDLSIQAMAWHPLGHMLATGGFDHKTKFWGPKRSGAFMLHDQADLDRQAAEANAGRW